MHSPTMAAGLSQSPVAAETNSKAGEDWRMWCRLCAKEDAQNISVFFKDEQLSNGNAAGSDAHNGSLSLAAAIAKYFWVNITRDEELPKVLCSDCFSLVTSLVNFSERVTKVQQLYCHLQTTPISNKADLHALRLRYGLTDEDREHVLIQQPLPEVYYFESKPKVIELEEKTFETEAEPEVEKVFTNPTNQQPRIKIKIKKENLLDERPEDEEAYDFGNEEEYDEDPFNSNDDTDNGDEDEDFVPTTALAKEVSSEDDEKPERKKITLVRKQRKTQNKFRTPQESNNPPKRRYRHKDDDSDGEKQDSESSKKDVKASGHRSKSEGEEIFTCTECAQSFRREHNYRMHMKHKHTDMASMPLIRCTECSRAFSTSRQLKQHSRKHLPPELKKVLPCPYCDKKFSTSWMVRTHIKHVHMDERPFICEECGEAVRTIATLKEHMLTHTDYAPFECEVCKKAFKNQARLKKHMEIHNPNKHICAACGLQLNSRATLNRHLLVHSDEMRHKCDYCGRAFKRAKALKSHLILHTGLKPYTCDFCDRTFANGSNCRSHKKKAHPEELAAQEAAGGCKTFTPNIPKLEALKAVAKVADNLTPVVSKQSGCFSFGRKPKLPPTGLQPKAPKVSKASAAEATTGTQHDLNALHSAVPSSALVNHGAGGIPTIDNIYSHIMKQASIAHGSLEVPDAGANSAAITIQIKRPPSESSASAGMPLAMDADAAQQQQQHLQSTTPQPQQPSQPSTPNANSNRMPTTEHFFGHIMKQQQASLAHEQSLSAMQQQHTLLQQQHEDISSIRSPDSQASHMTDDHSNASAAQLYTHMRQNVPGPYM